MAARAAANALTLPALDPLFRFILASKKTTTRR
jgi:hypothetical protein